jgi:tRNA uridine 5-carboxymethylaminomethyl modification enzyme
VTKKIEATEEIVKLFKKTSVSPAEANPMLALLETSPIPQNYKLDAVLARPQVTMNDMIAHLPTAQQIVEKYADGDVLLQAEILMKYEGYLEKEKQMAEKINRLEDIVIGDAFNYMPIQSMSMEAREKLSKQKPKTLGQASRISGISPADISVLMIHLGR